jgi:crossover junction endodeoxyribonuclease RuvC
VKILGIDPSTTSLGWGVIRVDGDQIIETFSGVIRPKASLSRPARLMQIYFELASLLQWYKPDSVGMEANFVGRGGTSTRAIAQSQGVVIVVAGLRGLDVAEYAPSAVKAAVAHGRASKAEVQGMVEALTGQHLENLDESDAVAVAICHWRELQTQELIGRVM